MEFTVPGQPLPLKRHRSYLAGGRIRCYNPSAKNQTLWRQRALATGLLPDVPLTGALKLVIVFYLQRPKSHYRAGKFSDQLKPSAPVFPTSTPDVDNLAKFVLDALNKVLFEDDSQVVELNCKKLFGEPRTTVRLTEIVLETV